MSSSKKKRDTKREIVVLRNKMKEMEEELEYFRGMFMEAHAREEVIKIIGHPAMMKRAPKVAAFGTDELKNVAQQVISVAAMESALGFSAPQLGISSRVRKVREYRSRHRLNHLEHHKTHRSWHSIRTQRKPRLRLNKSWRRK